MCTGCMACIGKCSKDAIYVKDELDKYNAYIDKTQCMNCGMCQRVCPQCNEVNKQDPIHWYQGWARTPEIRARGSSGGVATALAISFIRSGGVVCSCKQCDETFLFAVAKTEEEVVEFAGSKYIKSNPIGCYQQIQQILRGEIRVLFIGLPCQVDAVKRYVDAKWIKNLYTIDLICHGTPSPQILKKYLYERKKRISDYPNLKFRDKTNFRLFSNKNETLSDSNIRDWYLSSFLWGITYTENCYECQYTSIRRCSDITLGDSWGTNLSDELTNGVSLVMCQTIKGEELLKMGDLVLCSVSIDAAIANNRQLLEPMQRHPKRDHFFQLLRDGKSVSCSMSFCFPYLSFKRLVKLVLTRMRMLKR